MSPVIEEAIIKTLKYSEIFNFPLTFEEIYRYLITESHVTTKQLEVALNILISKEKINKDENFYFVNEDLKNEIANRKKWNQEIENIYIKVKEDLNFLKRIPFIKFVGVTGSVGAKSLRSGYDIDLFIICAQNTVWLCRFLTVFFLKKKNIYKSPYCANIYISENNLTWHEKNLYIANEIARVYSIINKNYMYEKFLIKNSWVTGFLANFNHYIPKYNSSILRSKQNFMSVFSLLLIPFEFISFTLQYLYMKPKITTEIVGLNRILFLKNDYSKKILEEYKKISSNPLLKEDLRK